jgi:hypothetical protein
MDMNSWFLTGKEEKTKSLFNENSWTHYCSVLFKSVVWRFCGLFLQENKSVTFYPVAFYLVTFYLVICVDPILRPTLPLWSQALTYGLAQEHH